jgi:Protein of unknown function (DUF2505)
VQFEIVHEFDIPLDAIELAVLSPSLIEKLAPRLTNMETVEQVSHAMIDGIFERVWSYRANVKIPGFAKPYVTPEMLGWDEHSSYDLKRHKAKWTIVPHVKPAWRKFFMSTGTYALVARGEGTARIIKGNLTLDVPVVRKVAEPMIVNEVKKTFEAEAATLRDLATLV